MAPVGSYDCLQAAIAGGANSVYFGIGNLNMRSKSSANFSLDDLAEIVSACKANGLQSYLTVNTIIYDDEIDQMHSLLDNAKKQGVSAVIACDQSVIDYVNANGISVHISTQANISNSEALRFYARYADVVVLARELNLFQVQKIHRLITEQNICGPSGKLVQLEMFCHGALCMAISGKCYLSLHREGMSANRGACRQMCRKSYSARDTETGAELQLEDGFIMSQKDLCTLEFLPLMLAAGIRVFKIEGRARPCEYVKKTCECYNRAFDAIAHNSFDSILSAELVRELRTVFNRGFWDGYYQGAQIGQWSNTYGSQATRTKTYIARTTNYFSKIGVAEFILEAGSVKTGDTVIVCGPKTGVVEFHITSLRAADGSPADSFTKGNVFTLPVPCKLRLADKMYLWEENKNTLL
ncbi:MAG: U32 family peptidase [Spirochaetaceae bacterium]|jgi:putative protease|nr:U32 family peptidase [Spirochaetaceae bacterium]